jgi:tetratricopeptide (TPR) repeat protein
MTIVRPMAAAILLLSFAAGCAPKRAPTTAPGAPRHPEFVFPSATESLGPKVVADLEAAWQALQTGDARTAERRYRGLLRQAPGAFPAHAGLGYVSLSRKDYDEALAHFDRALAVDQSYAPALAGKGHAYLAMNRRPDALANFDAALAADPGLTAIRPTADALRFQGVQGSIAAARKAAEAGRLAEARTAYSQAIQASPQSPFLHRELAVVERRDGRLPDALTHVQKAVALDPNDGRSFVILADVLEAMGQFEKAAAALTNAAALEPSEALDTRLEALRARAALEAMPPEFRAIAGAPAITRAQLAALIGTRLDALLKRAPRQSSAVITDARGNWAAQWILPVARAGFMEVYANHTFQPAGTVRRGDLAFAASRILGVIAAENPKLGASWRSPRRKFPDLSPGHLSYPAVAVAVEAGVMQPVETGAFQLSRPVTGAEAVSAVDRLVDLAGRRR